MWEGVGWVLGLISCVRDARLLHHNGDGDGGGGDVYDVGLMTFAHQPDCCVSVMRSKFSLLPTSVSTRDFGFCSAIYCNTSHDFSLSLFLSLSIFYFASCSFSLHQQQVTTASTNTKLTTSTSTKWVTAYLALFSLPRRPVPPLSGSFNPLPGLLNWVMVPHDPTRIYVHIFLFFLVYIFCVIFFFPTPSLSRCVPVSCIFLYMKKPVYLFKFVSLSSFYSMSVLCVCIFLVFRVSLCLCLSFVDPSRCGCAI